MSIVKPLSVIKRINIDFFGKPALTLDSFEVTDLNLKDRKVVKKILEDRKRVYTRTHESGWTISGCLHEDYFIWVEEFVAIHPTFGIVSGDFMDEVYSSSEEAFAHFYKHHEPNAWDFADI